ncbi:hypothetical protein PMAYCL1PPCAC_08264, partial [Pristionchus mayeri]
VADIDDGVKKLDIEEEGDEMNKTISELLLNDGTKMQHRYTELTCTEREILPMDTQVFQVEDGTLYYYKYSSPQKLYINVNGKKVNANLPEFWLGGVGVIGNALYFMTESKIYKCSHSPSDEISVDLMRVINHERAYCGALLSEESGGVKMVYRMNEGPEHGIIVDVPKEELDGLRIAGLHRRTIVYVSPTHNENESLPRLIGNVLIIKFRHASGARHHCYTPEDASPFIYISSESSLITLNTDTMKFMPMLHFKNVSIGSIAGIRNGEITLIGKNEIGEVKLLTAQLPDGYMLSEDPAEPEMYCERL